MGIEDLRQGKLSEDACLVLVAAPRLRMLGIDIPNYDLNGDSPSHRLYRILERRLGPGAHSAYNALIRRVVSAARALPDSRVPFLG